ncbi:uncharacterized protein LOC107263934 isoform X2 [Cephus cinctus]|uniref:Uncharacterized protein LOC107263934 isoform X2 n=1 Tax=Cephus cinctus TaxID=211228 RepID=A0AAJ7BJF1_CEPCN|nr:uncharacterized protein LOC107263934 isoform X2 [Cephus cinctus]
MEDDQQFCLRWNNHQSTLVQNFDTLLESGTLVDCTLAAEGKSLKAHKVVLSACSPFFEGLLSEHYDKHPVFILKDIKFKELKAMMDYMYKGEVNISQDQLAALLKAAESLQIKGLSECKTSGNSGGGGCGGRSEPRPPKVVSQPTAPSLDIPHPSSGLTIEKNSKVPRQSLTQVSVGDLPEDSASPQLPRGLSSREGSQSPTNAKRKKRFRGRSLGDDNSVENHDASNSSDMPQQMGVSSLAIAPVANEKSHADPTDSLGSSVLMQQLAKPADEMLQMPLENQQPNDNLIEPKSEYLEDPEESVEDLTLDDDMNDLNEMEQDTNRAGPSHESSQHPGLAAWHVTGDRSNAGGVVGSVAGAPGTNDEVFLAAQEAAQAHRDSQDCVHPCDRMSTVKIQEEVELENLDNIEMAMDFLDDKFPIEFEFDETKPALLCESTSFEISSYFDRVVKPNYLNEKTSDIKVNACFGNVAEEEIDQKTFSTFRTSPTLKIQSEKLERMKEETIDVVSTTVNKKSSKKPRRRRRATRTVLTSSTKPDKNAVYFCIMYSRMMGFVSCQRVTYPCKNCGKVYNYHSSLARHLKHECGVEPKFHCPLCPYRTKHKSSLNTHLNGRHMKLLKRRTEGTLNAPSDFRCPRCGRSYKVQRSLRRHLIVECGKAPKHKCPYCPHYSKYRASIAKHVTHRHPNLPFF